MSGGLSDIRNYNVGFEIFLKAVEEYGQYVYGLDNQLFKKYFTEDIENVEDEAAAKAAAEARKTEIADKKASKLLISRLLDRTCGANSIGGMQKIIAASDGDAKITQRQDVILSCFNSSDSVVSSITVNKLASDPSIIDALPGKPSKDTISIYDVVKSSFQEDGVPFPETFLNLNSGDTKSIDRFKSPTLSAHVIRKTEYSPAGRQAEHLPIFLSAIPPIEMAKCVPYVEIKFVHQSNLSNSDTTKPTSPKLTASRLFRFSPSNTFDRVIPKGASSTATDVDEHAESNFAYMDLFNSPQTAVNANINQGGGVISGLLQNFVDSLTDSEESSRPDDSRVLDPFQPFLSFISMDLSEQGKYGGFLATREGSIKLKLHDKSKMKDLSPMLAVDEFSFNYFVVEFGWSHPEGKLLSNNTVGQYLDNLRTINSYNITNVNYDFGEDNSVDITLNLVTRGAKSAVPKVSAFGGFYSNLSVFEGLIRDSIAKYERIHNPEAKDVRLLKDVRNKVRVKTGNVSSLSRLVTFDNLKAVKELSDKVKENKAQFYTDLGVLLGIDPSDEDSQKGNFASPGSVMNKKLEWLAKTPDPFQCATRFEDKVTTEFWRDNGEPHPDILTYYNENKSVEGKDTVVSAGHVTLGKLLAKFVGFPLSTCGVFDEVQMFFYPVNHHAAGARRHTTASLPIQLSVLENDIRKKFEKKGKEDPNYAFSVEGFIKTCQNILMKKEITAYRLSGDISNGTRDLSSYTKILTDFRDKKRDDKIAYLKDNAQKAIFEKIGFTKYEPEATEEKAKRAEEQKKISEFLNKLSKFSSETLSNLLTEMYQKEGGDQVQLAASGPTFEPVNLEVFFEVCPVVDDGSPGTTPGPFDGIVSAFKGIEDAFNEKEDAITSDGLFIDKNILKLHVYDANTITYPDLQVFGLGTKESGIPIFGELLGESAAIKARSEASDILNNFNWWKTVIASKYPTIVHGASNSTVKRISINSNVSEQIKTIKIVEAKEKNFNRQLSEELSEDFDESLFFPSSVVIQLMGNPSINRGASLFVDFKTGTSLDNIYNVNSVTHTITPGDFTTTINCLTSNQNIVQSVRSDFLELIKEKSK